MTGVTALGKSAPEWNCCANGGPGGIPTAVAGWIPRLIHTLTYPVSPPSAVDEGLRSRTMTRERNGLCTRNRTLRVRLLLGMTTPTGGGTNAPVSVKTGTPPTT